MMDFVDLNSLDADERQELRNTLLKLAVKDWSRMGGTVVVKPAADGSKRMVAEWKIQPQFSPFRSARSFYEDFCERWKRNGLDITSLTLIQLKGQDGI